MSRDTLNLVGIVSTDSVTLPGDKVGGYGPDAQKASEAFSSVAKSGAIVSVARRRFHSMRLAE
jgi:acyl-coenzyme A synthetase/AMP-(fatty) acid ligase